MNRTTNALPALAARWSSALFATEFCQRWFLVFRLHAGCGSRLSAHGARRTAWSVECGVSSVVGGVWRVAGVEWDREREA